MRQLVEVIVALTETGLDYFFIHPLQLAEVGTVSLATARIGVGAARTGIPRLVRRVVGSMDDEERLAIADFLDGILIRG